MSNAILDFTQTPNGVYVSKWKIKPQVVVKGAGYQVISQGILHDEFVHDVSNPVDISPSLLEGEGAIYDFKSGRIVQKMPGFRHIILDMDKRTLDEVVGRRARIVNEKQIGDLSIEQIYAQDLDETGKSLDVTV